MLYRVGLTKTTTSFTYVTVDAIDEEEAEDLAWEMADKLKGWEIGDEEIDTEFVEEVEGDD
jgi:hypothetical protein